MTNHLSRYSKIFPRHTREFTRTYTATKKKKKSKRMYGLSKRKHFDISDGIRHLKGRTRLKKMYLCIDRPPESRKRSMKTHSE